MTARSPTDAIAAAVTATAKAIDAFGDNLSAPFRERELQAMLVVALTASVATPLGLIVKPNRSVTFAEWPGVGPVDVSLLDEQGEPAAFLELKWGAGALYNCIWDLPKMAVAIAREHTPRAYLIAATPAADWTNSDGSELFDTREHSVAELLVRYSKYFGFWSQDVKTHPLLLPTRIRTQHVAAVAMQVRHDNWSLRAVEVLVAGGGWFEVRRP